MVFYGVAVALAFASLLPMGHAVRTDDGEIADVLTSGKCQRSCKMLNLNPWLSAENEEEVHRLLDAKCFDSKSCSKCDGKKHGTWTPCCAAGGCSRTRAASAEDYTDAAELQEDLGDFEEIAMQAEAQLDANEDGVNMDELKEVLWKAPGLSKDGPVEGLGLTVPSDELATDPQDMCYWAADMPCATYLKCFEQPSGSQLQDGSTRDCLAEDGYGEEKNCFVEDCSTKFGPCNEVCGRTELPSETTGIRDNQLDDQLETLDDQLDGDGVAEPAVNQVIESKVECPDKVLWNHKGFPRCRNAVDGHKMFMKFVKTKCCAVEIKEEIAAAAAARMCDSLDNSPCKKAEGKARKKLHMGPEKVQGSMQKIFEEEGKSGVFPQGFKCVKMYHCDTGDVLVGPTKSCNYEDSQGITQTIGSRRNTCIAMPLESDEGEDNEAGEGDD